jgi:transcriptional regulator with XRE-family HTH domain
MKNNIRNVRKAVGLTQSALGAMVGVPGVYISRYESGEVGVSTDMVVKLAHALNSTPSHLLGFSDSKTTLQAERDEGVVLLERAAILAAEYVEKLSPQDRKAVSSRKFGKFVACLYAVLAEQQDLGQAPIPPGDTVMRMMLSQAGHDQQKT